MFLIYVDEAGTSAPEPVSVVVGIIVDVDRQWRACVDQLTKITLKEVPEHYREGFIFHAKSLWGDGRLRDRWSREQRLALVEGVLAIPRLVGLGVSVGKVRRDAPKPNLVGTSLTPELLDHVAAFGNCIARADKFVRDRGAADAMAAVVAEDVPTRRKALRKSLKIFRELNTVTEYPINEASIIPTTAEKLTGKITQTAVGRMSRVIDTVHFVEKTDAPILQIADACAFAFRRYFSAQSGGTELMHALFGEDVLSWDDWQGPSSDVVFGFPPSGV